VKRVPMGVFVLVALALAVGLATAVSPFASASPDGLERVAGEEGFLAAGKPHALQDASPIRDYAFPGIENARVATGLAGFTGTLLVFGLGSGAAALARRRRSPAAPTV
jgi:hypothetical protein